jgi:hypothetical protein
MLEAAVRWLAGVCGGDGLQMIGSVAAIVGSVIIALPALLHVRDQQLWSRINTIRRNQPSTKQHRQTTEVMRDALLSDFFDGWRRVLKFMIGGFVFLGVAAILSVGDACLIDSAPDVPTNAGTSATQ